MGFLIGAVIFAILAFVAGSYKGISRIFALIAFVSFIVWLGTGPGFSLLNWLNDPSVPTPDIDVPGVR